jgi:hypothetical protein
LNVQHDTFALSRGGQKAFERPNTANRLLDQSFCQRPEGQGTKFQLDFAHLPGFFDVRGMLQNQIKCGQTSRRVSQSSLLGNTGMEFGAVHASTSGCQAANSACWDLRASSRSTVFIMDEGPASAFFLSTVR